MGAMPTRGRISGLALLTIALSLLFVGAACAQKPLTLDERAQALDKRIMCPVCPGETIDQTQAEIGKQMRALVREKLAEGWTDQQVLDYFADRYGPSILATPPKGGFSVLVWIGPPIGIVAALVGLAMVLRAMRRGARVAQPETVARKADLAPYLDVVDQELTAGQDAPPKGRGAPARNRQGRQR